MATQANGVFASFDDRPQVSRSPSRAYKCNGDRCDLPSQENFLMNPKPLDEAIENETPVVLNTIRSRVDVEAMNNSPKCQENCISDSRSSVSTACSTRSANASIPLFGLPLSQCRCKRADYISWHEYFFATALLSAKRSKDPHFPRGACLVDNNHRIVGIGYNGFPAGFPDENLPWDEYPPGGSDEEWLASREPFVIPAEVNCLLNSPKTASDLTLYCVDFPSHDCAKFIVQSRRVKRVIYGYMPPLTDSLRVSQVLFEQASLDTELFQLSRPVELIFSTIDPACATDERTDDACASSHLTWDEYFMAIALLTARRSKDPNTQVGCCIVSSLKIILACGYNGFTVGCSDDAFPWQRSAEDPKHTKYMYVCHAEVNALLNCQVSRPEQDNSTLYVTLFPCYQCAQSLIQAGVRRIVYLQDPYRDYVQFQASRRLLEIAGVSFEAFLTKRNHIILENQVSNK